MERNVKITRNRKLRVVEAESYLGFSANEALGTAGSGGPFGHEHPNIQEELDQALENVKNRTPPNMEDPIKEGIEVEMFHAPPLVAMRNDPSFITGPKSQLVILSFSDMEDQSGVFVEMLPDTDEVVACNLEYTCMT